MYDIIDIFDRMLALNVNNEYLDEDKIYYICDGKLYMYLNRYIDYLLLNKQSVKDIIILEGVTKVILNLDCLKNLAFRECNIVFSSTVEYVGEETSCSDAVDIQLEGLVEGERRLKNVTFDFRKATKLEVVTASSFRSVICESIYFSENVLEVYDGAFSNTHINTVYLPNVEVVWDYVFYKAHIKNLYLGRNIHRVYSRGLDVYTELDSLTLNHLTVKENNIFGNITNIYMAFELTQENKNKVESFALNKKGLYLNIEMCIYDYLRSKEEIYVYEKSKLSIFLLSLVSDSKFVKARHKFYFYDIKSDVAVESRRYILLDNSDGFPIYLEEGMFDMDI